MAGHLRCPELCSRGQPRWRGNLGPPLRRRCRIGRRVYPTFLRGTDGVEWMQNKRMVYGGVAEQESAELLRLLLLRLWSNNPIGADMQPAVAPALEPPVQSQSSSPSFATHRPTAYDHPLCRATACHHLGRIDNTPQVVSSRILLRSSSSRSRSHVIQRAIRSRLQLYVGVA